MTDHTTETETPPPPAPPAPAHLPSATDLQNLLRRVPEEPVDPHNARQVAYHLNQRRAVIGHTTAAIQKAEIELEEAHQMRAMLHRQNERVVAEINDLDRTIKAKEAFIAALRGGV